MLSVKLFDRHDFSPNLSGISVDCVSPDEYGPYEYPEPIPGATLSDLSDFSERYAAVFFVPGDVTITYVETSFGWTNSEDIYTIKFVPAN